MGCSSSVLEHILADKLMFSPTVRLVIYVELGRLSNHDGLVWWEPAPCKLVLLHGHSAYVHIWHVVSFGASSNRSAPRAEITEVCR